MPPHIGSQQPRFGSIGGRRFPGVCGLADDELIVPIADDGIHLLPAICATCAAESILGFLGNGTRRSSGRCSMRWAIGCETMTHLLKNPAAGCLSEGALRADLTNRSLLPRYCITKLQHSTLSELCEDPYLDLFLSVPVRLVRLGASTRRVLTPCALTCFEVRVRYGAGPSLRTVNLGAAITRGFSAFTRLHVCYPRVYQQPLRCFCAPTLARLDGLTDRVEVHRSVSPAPLTCVLRAFSS